MAFSINYFLHVVMKELPRIYSVNLKVKIKNNNFYRNIHFLCSSQRRYKSSNRILKYFEHEILAKTFLLSSKMFLQYSGIFFI